MLNDHGSDRVARRKPIGERLYGLAVCPFERAIGRRLALPLIEPESQELPDDAAGSVGPERDRGEVACFRCARDEQRVEDTHRPAALDPLQRADQLPLKSRVRSEPVG